MRAKGESLPLNKILRALRIVEKGSPFSLYFYCAAENLSCESELSLPRSGSKPKSGKKLPDFSDSFDVWRV